MTDARPQLEVLLTELASTTSSISALEGVLEELRQLRDEQALVLTQEYSVPLRKLAPIARTTDSYLAKPRIEARIAARRGMT